MRNVSNEWLAAISTGRDYSIDEKKRGCAVPVTPWLHPPVGKRLRDLITKLGTVRELDRQEILYPQGRKISDIVLVQQGVTVIAGVRDSYCRGGVTVIAGVRDS